jgi:hypothetical protein
MSVRITTTQMTSNTTTHRAVRVPGARGARRWRVSWLAGRLLDRDEAVTAMLLAEEITQTETANATGEGPGSGSGSGRSPRVQALLIAAHAAELGLTSTEARALVTGHKEGRR